MLVARRAPYYNAQWLLNLWSLPLTTQLFCVVDAAARGAREGSGSSGTVAGVWDPMRQRRRWAIQKKEHGQALCFVLCGRWWPIPSLFAPLTPPRPPLRSPKTGRTAELSTQLFDDSQLGQLCVLKLSIHCATAFRDDRTDDHGAFQWPGKQDRWRGDTYIVSPTHEMCPLLASPLPFISFYFPSPSFSRFSRAPFSPQTRQLRRFLRPSPPRSTQHAWRIFEQRAKRPTVWSAQSETGSHRW